MQARVTARTAARAALLTLAAAWLIYTYGTFMNVPAVGIFHDDGIYLVTAKSMAEGEEAEKSVNDSLKQIDASSRESEFQKSRDRDSSV